MSRSHITRADGVVLVNILTDEKDNKIVMVMDQHHPGRSIKVAARYFLMSRPPLLN